MRARAITPILNVSDIAASVDWFGKLGWSPGFLWSGPGESAPSFGSVTSGDVEIFLCLNGQGGRDGDPNGGAGAWMSVWFGRPRDVDEVHATCVREGLDVLRAPADEPWNVRELQVRHPDGHVLRISAPTPAEHRH